MRFGVREICEVVLKAKVDGQKVGNTTFAKHEPVLYFDSLKASTLESATTTVYATGGRGNTRLIAWEGEKTVTFTMEDALLSPMGFAILSGAGIVKASATSKIKVHAKSIIAAQTLSGTGTAIDPYEVSVGLTSTLGTEALYSSGLGAGVAEPTIFGLILDSKGQPVASMGNPVMTGKVAAFEFEGTGLTTGSVNVLVDYYIEKTSGAQQIEIEAGDFAGNYYLEASTLFRDEDGRDLAAEFVIPNMKIQSNFTFSMASTGDPSTFTFTAHAFPDFTKFDPTKKVMYILQIMG